MTTNTSFSKRNQREFIFPDYTNQVNFLTDLFSAVLLEILKNVTAISSVNSLTFFRFFFSNKRSMYCGGLLENLGLLGFVKKDIFSV